VTISKIFAQLWAKLFKEPKLILVQIFLKLKLHHY